VTKLTKRVERLTATRSKPGGNGRGLVVALVPADLDGPDRIEFHEARCKTRVALSISLAYALACVEDSKSSEATFLAGFGVTKKKRRRSVKRFGVL